MDTSWIVAIITLAGSTAITTTVGLTIKHYFDKYLKRKEKEANEAAEAEKRLKELEDERLREERKADVAEAIKCGVKPLEEKVDAIDHILTCYYRCTDKGFRNDYDYENIHHMYESYSSLHGNSFIQYVILRFDELPTKEEFVTAQKKLAKKKVSK